MTRDSFFQELFNRPPTQEEQSRFDRLGVMMSLGQDDSMWYVILINEFYDDRMRSRLKDIETVANSAARAALLKISEAVNQKADDIASIKSKGFLWRAWGFMLSFVVILGAICVNAGYVMGSGKYPFWLSPTDSLERIIGYFLNVPSGWIFLLGTAPFLLEIFSSSVATIKMNARLNVKGKSNIAIIKAISSLLMLSIISCLIFQIF